MLEIFSVKHIFLPAERELFRTQNPLYCVKAQRARKDGGDEYRPDLTKR